MKRERKVLKVPVDRGPYAGEYAVADQREPDRVGVRRKRAQARDKDQADRDQGQEDGRVQCVQEGRTRPVLRRGQDAIQYELERPGLEQLQPRLREQRAQRGEDEEPLAFKVGPEVAGESPETPRRPAGRQRASHPPARAATYTGSPAPAPPRTPPSYSPPSPD